MFNPTFVVDPEEKAGYNSAGKITELLAMLRSTFTSSMMTNDFSASLECCRGVINIISGKINPTIIGKLNGMIYEIEKWIPSARQTYSSESISYYSHPQIRVTIKRNIEFLWRKIEKVQDDYGYGMFSEEESGL